MHDDGEQREILTKNMVQGVQMLYEQHLCFPTEVLAPWKIWLKTWCKEYRCDTNNICVFLRKTLAPVFPGNVIASEVAMFFSKVRTSCVPLQRSQGTILQIHFGGIEDWLHYVNKRIIVTWNNLVQGVQMWHEPHLRFSPKNSLHPFSGERHCFQSRNVFLKWWHQVYRHKGIKMYFGKYTLAEWKICAILPVVQTLLHEKIWCKECWCDTNTSAFSSGEIEKLMTKLYSQLSKHCNYILQICKLYFTKS